METIVLGVEPRIIKKGDAEKLRKSGIVPAVVYHKGEETVAIGVNELALKKLCIRLNRILLIFSFRTVKSNAPLSRTFNFTR